MAGVRDLVQRARAGRLRSSEMSDPTITVTNLGERGVDLVHGVIYPPQVALVGFGAVRERPWAVDGMLGVRPIVIATLAADHRASDGHAGSRFLDSDRPQTSEAGGAMNEQDTARGRDQRADRGRTRHRPGRDRCGPRSRRSSWTSTRWTSSTSSWRSTSGPGSRSPSATIPKLSTLSDAVAYLAAAQKQGASA